MTTRPNEKEKQYYCIFCGKEPIPGKGFPSPCNVGSGGSHRIKYRGQIEYRVRSLTGAVHKSSIIPDGYTVIEEIVY